MGKPRGVVVFDLDGTLIDDMEPIARCAAAVIHEAFGTPVEKAMVEYFSTTGKPFDRQLMELYPDKSPAALKRVAMHFHEVKVKEAYARAKIFPEVPILLKTLVKAGWVLVVATGAEKPMAELILEREGIAFLIDDVMGAQQGTKDHHLRAYMERWPGVPHVLVGDSKFDMEVAREVPGLIVVGRACHFPGWVLTPADLRRLGATWADYSLEPLPGVLGRIAPPVVEGRDRELQEGGTSTGSV